jgi:hypothetical protein
MQSQKRVTVYKVDAKGDLEPTSWSSASAMVNAQIIRGAKEGDTFVVRAHRRQSRAAQVLTGASIMTETRPLISCRASPGSTGWETRKCARSTA